MTLFYITQAQADLLRICRRGLAVELLRETCQDLMVATLVDIVGWDKADAILQASAFSEGVVPVEFLETSIRDLFGDELSTSGIINRLVPNAA